MKTNARSDMNDLNTTLLGKYEVFDKEASGGLLLYPLKYTLGLSD